MYFSFPHKHKSIMYCKCIYHNCCNVTQRSHKLSFHTFVCKKPLVMVGYSIKILSCGYIRTFKWPNGKKSWGKPKRKLPGFTCHVAWEDEKIIRKYWYIEILQYFVLRYWIDIQKQCYRFFLIVNLNALTEYYFYVLRSNSGR